MEERVKDFGTRHRYNSNLSYGAKLNNEKRRQNKSNTKSNGIVYTTVTYASRVS